MNTKNLIIRTVSGVVYAVLIAGAIFYDKFFFAAEFAIIGILTTCEFHKLINKLENVDTLIWTGIVSSFVLFLSLILSYYNSDFQFLTEKLIFCIYLLLIFCVFILEIFRKKPNPVNNIAYFLMGQIYIAVPFMCLISIRFNFERIILLAFFVIIWANDVFAYLVGSLIGKHKLCERISPNKSWEGFIGGMAGALIAGFVFSQFNSELNLLKWFLFAFIVAISGTLGDLFESLIKRTVGVKDSGNIMPGHGGFLDRLDSVLFAAPAVLIFLFFLK